jgi:nicotinate-nucleotide adenylyltransferase
VASIENRIEMTRLAILGVPRLKLDLWESRQEKPSFTIDTLRYLKESSDAELFLLLSDETALSFQQWREPEAILALASPLVGSRHNAPSHHCPHLLREGWTRTPLLEISSTQIRERLKAGLYCGHLVPDKVLDYITKNPVYFRP